MRSAWPLLVLLCVVPVRAQPPPAQPAGPKLMMLEILHDVGRVDRGATVRHSFVYGNTGNAELRVKVTPGHGCTVTDFDATLAPGAVGKITIEYPTAGEHGPVTRIATMMTNDPAMAQFDVGVASNVMAPI